MPVTSAVLTSRLNQNRNFTIATVSTGREIALADSGAILRSQGTSAITLNIPTCASVFLPIGFCVQVHQAEAGQVTFSGNSGVSVLTPTSGSLGTARIGARIYAMKVGSDTWDVYGQVSAKW